VERFFLSDEYSKIGKVPRRRRLKIVNIAKVLGGFLVLLLLIELFSILLENLSLKPVIAQWGTIEKGFWAEALFLRDETLLFAPIDGDLVLKLADGSRIPQGEIVADITNRKEDLTGLKQENASTFRNSEYNLPTHQSMAKRIKHRPTGIGLVAAKNVGYLFYRYDEWETYFTPDQFGKLTIIDFNRIYSLKTPVKQIRDGMVVGKVIHPFHQIISFIVNPKQIGMPVIGDLWWLKNGKNTFPCPVVNLIKLTDGRMIVGLDDVSMLPEYMPERRAKVFIIFKRISGISVPVQALYKRGHDTVVKIVKGEESKEIKVVVRENDGVKAIIDGIEFGTTIISR
jgi:hypothetical protein